LVNAARVAKNIVPNLLMQRSNRSVKTVNLGVASS